VADPLEIQAAFGSERAQVAGTYQFLGSVWTGSNGENEGGKTSVAGEVSVELLQVEAAVGYDTDHNFSLGVGYDLVKTPKSFSKLVEVSVGVEGRVEAPVVVHGLTRGSKPGLPTVLAGYAAKVAKYLTEPTPCPYCSARGDLDCPTCRNTRTVVCPKCNGKLHFACSRCKGGGELVCGNCRGSLRESCRDCGGSGHLRCYTCSGSGQVTVYESQTRTRQELVIDQVGFDEAGNPIYNRHYETREYTEQVPVRQACGSCAGSGSRGACGTCGGDGQVTCRTCGGGGTVPCSTCKGTGQVNCGKCRGTGKVTCPTCRGKALNCPLCKGRKTLGQ